jgi:hypothetical protein
MRNGVSAQIGLAGRMLLCLGRFNRQHRKNQSGRHRLTGKSLAYYHENGDKAFAAFSRQGELSTRTVMSLYWIPRA